ncbi:putative ribonuclease H-like domain-containing protein [Tanacetum coccineum]|uniref:Ribonuclease H-like domain-containing protein n=1 Tax=Tanacetum coccineum TaxID=301880 RepID=A0ABQ5DN90_9ASTR
MQEELLQFQLQKVWTLVNLPNGKRAIGTKWVFRNKKDEKGIVIRNKVRLVAQAVNRIFRYLKGQPKLGLWYPRDSPFDLEAFTDSDYVGASLDWKSTTGGYQFLGKRLTSWQCKKQTIFANSTTKAEYVAAANCCGQVKLCTASTNVTAARLNKKELAIPGQTATGKEFSNPLMAGILLKTISAKFWNTATSKIVNSVKQIHAIVDGKAVVISESSVRNDLLFDDEDGITCLTNDDIFENLALMGNLDSKKFLMYPRFLQLFLNNQLKDLPEPINDTYVTPCHTKKVFSNMARKSVNFSGNIMIGLVYLESNISIMKA